MITEKHVVDRWQVSLKTLLGISREFKPAEPDPTLDQGLDAAAASHYLTAKEIAEAAARANPNVARRIIAMIASGRLKVRDLITHTFALEDFAKALDTFVNRRDEVIKVVIEPNGAEEPGS